MQPAKTVTAPGELLPFLFAAWPEVKKTKIRQWLKHGSVRVNGVAITHHAHPLRTGDAVQIQVEKPDPAAAALPLGLRIVFEDDAMIVIEKPADLLSVATDTGGNERTAYFALTDYVRQRHRRDARVWIVHRLDKETSGLMVFARTMEAKKWLQEHWQQMEKRYQAVVTGRLAEPVGTLRHHLDEGQPHRVMIRPAGPETREAVTHYRLLGAGNGRSLLELTLATGRRHQIRVQLAASGCPLVGDSKYGPGAAEARGRLCLHASLLKLIHPTTEVEMKFESPLPLPLVALLGPNFDRDGNGLAS